MMETGSTNNKKTRGAEIATQISPKALKTSFSIGWDCT